MGFEKAVHGPPHAAEVVIRHSRSWSLEFAEPGGEQSFPLAVAGGIEVITINEASTHRARGQPLCQGLCTLPTALGRGAMPSPILQMRNLRSRECVAVTQQATRRVCL